MKVLTTLAFLLTTLPVFAQQKDNRIVIGTVDTVYSKILNEKRMVWVHVPSGGGDVRYPVLYLLDGESHFYSAVGILEQLSGVLPDMIVVGITNTVRNRDLTPTHIAQSKIVGEEQARNSGGGGNFIGFIEKELMPYIEAHYPTAPYRVFSGHSLGGLTVVNALINHTKLFNAYIAIDPSLWWDDQKWAKHIESNMAGYDLNNRALFVGIANNMPKGMDTIAVLKDTLNNNTLVTRSVLPFVQTLREVKPSGLRWSSKYYPNEQHGTVELNAEYDALRYLFSYYRFRSSQFDGHPELNVFATLDNHFKNISEKFGYPVHPGEDLVNQLGYSCLGNKRLDEAYRLFKMNTDNHPNSANAFDSLGDYYAETGDKQKAIEAFTRALNLKEDAETRKKLEALKGK